MNVNGASSDRAPARERNARVTEARDERAERQNRGTHRFHQFVRGFLQGHSFGLDGELAGRQIRAFDAATHMREQLGHGDDVAHVRNILQRHRLVREQRGGHCGQRGIFRAADSDRAFATCVRPGF